VFVRPEDLRLVDEGPSWPATIVGTQRSGPRLRLRARLEGQSTEVEIELPADQEGRATAPGQGIRLAPKRFGWFPRDGATAPA
jgi:sulfate transport system ATP-binding protein